jgi:hypothetical protein
MEGPLLIFRILSRSINKHGRFQPNFDSFGQVVSEEKIFLEINQSETRMACAGHEIFFSETA